MHALYILFKVIETDIEFFKEFIVLKFRKNQNYERDNLYHNNGLYQKILMKSFFKKQNKEGDDLFGNFILYFF